MENRADLLKEVAPERRDFLKKIAIAAAFAAPTIATFSVDGMRRKAFAQAAYSPPEVLSLVEDVGYDRAFVTFTQPMDTTVLPVLDSAGADRLISRGLLPCSSFSFQLTGATVNTVTWRGNTMHVISFSGCGSNTLKVTYNQGGCSERFRGENGLELVPWSGSIFVNPLCD